MNPRSLGSHNYSTPSRQANDANKFRKRHAPYILSLYKNNAQKDEVENALIKCYDISITLEAAYNENVVYLSLLFEVS